MPNLLGIDYGTEIIGISIATTPLAEPLSIVENNPAAIDNIRRISTTHSIEKIIVGISEGEMAIKSRDFGQKLSEIIHLPVEFHDETLSSYEANQLLRHAKKSLRDQPQDAYQATVMLQDYLDTHTDKPL